MCYSEIEVPISLQLSDQSLKIAGIPRQGCVLCGLKYAMMRFRRVHMKLAIQFTTLIDLIASKAKTGEPFICKEMRRN